MSERKEWRRTANAAKASQKKKKKKTAHKSVRTVQIPKKLERLQQEVEMIPKIFKNHKVLNWFENKFVANISHP